MKRLPHFTLGRYQLVHEDQGISKEFLALSMIEVEWMCRLGPGERAALTEEAT